MQTQIKELEETDRIVKVLELGERTHEFIVKEDCPKCGYDRATEVYHEISDVGRVVCRACDNIIHEG